VTGDRRGVGASTRSRSELPIRVGRFRRVTEETPRSCERERVEDRLIFRARAGRGSPERRCGDFIPCSPGPKDTMTVTGGTQVAYPARPERRSRKFPALTNGPRRYAPRGQALVLSEVRNYSRFASTRSGSPRLFASSSRFVPSMRLCPHPTAPNRRRSRKTGNGFDQRISGFF
jgi:hypothetical protein